MYVYMSNLPGTVDLNTLEIVALPKEAEFRCRGEVLANDDPQGFKRLMAKRGHSVVLTDDLIGTPKKGTVVATAKELGVGHLIREA